MRRSSRWLPSDPSGDPAVGDDAERRRRHSHAEERGNESKTPPSQPASGETLPGGRVRGWQHAQHKQPVIASFHVLSLGARSHWTACQANSEIAGSSLVRAPELDQVIRVARRFDSIEKSAVFSIRQWLGPLERSGWHLHGRRAQRPAAHRQFRHPTFIVIDGDAR
jgi:hypothetical protein